MIVAIDVGNSNISIGAYSGDKLLFLSRISTKNDATADEYAVKLRHVFDLYGHAAAEMDCLLYTSSKRSIA